MIHHLSEIQSRTFTGALVCAFLCQLVVTLSATANDRIESLYSDFSEPPMESRPYARWWWNGNSLEKQEIDRQLEILSEAGFGGVEITPIRMPEYASPKGEDGLVWLSREWCQMLEHAVDKADSLGMAVELIAGTGWPFGGENVPPEEQTQRIALAVIPLPVGQEKALDLLEPFIDESLVGNSHYVAPRLKFAYLAPEHLESLEEMSVIQPEGDETSIRIDASEQPRQLIIGAILTGISIKPVTYAAPGNSGPVLDHYDRTAVDHYFSRIRNAFEKHLPEGFASRLLALFVDSVELSGSDWTDDLEVEFLRRRGYALTPYLPFVAYVNEHAGYPALKWKLSETLREEVRRVRYDFSLTLSELLRERFILPFHEWCRDMGTRSKYQPYGMPFLYDMIEGGMIPDIPESNNWIFSDYPYYHGYRAWNKYTSSAGHLSGASRISCEAMTNGRGVFRTTLDTIKQADDLNFIMGTNHAVVHGYNYSPESAGFPGWIRFGTYFSEHNTWWEQLPEWTEYHARLSALFTNTQPVGEIAILAPQADVWSEWGLPRQPFQVQPYYANQLWEPLQQIGYNTDYINERLLREAKIADGRLICGNMQFNTVILCDVKSISPTTLDTLIAFLGNGGNVVFIGNAPQRNPGGDQAGERDADVKKKMVEIRTHNRAHFVEQAPDEKPWLHWVSSWQHLLPEPEGVHVLNPDDAVFTYRQSLDNTNFVFIANSGPATRTPALRFPGGYPEAVAVWNPETGERSRLVPDVGNRALSISLPAHSSILLAVGDNAEYKIFSPDPVTRQEIPLNKWELRLESVDGITMAHSIDFSSGSPQEQIPSWESFSGKLVYQTTFDCPAESIILDLGNLAYATELRLNGKTVDSRWYGQHQYSLEDLTPGVSYSLEIILTTTLWNHMLDNRWHPTADFFVSRSESEEPRFEGLPNAPVLRF